jgi:hypothetical protein
LKKWKKWKKSNHFTSSIGLVGRDGLVGYDAALTRLRSWAQFPVLVFFKI